MQKGKNYDRINYNLHSNILRFFKGILIGCSFVIPGLCSAMVAMILNEYQNLLLIIENFYNFKIVKKHFLLILGIVIGIVVIIICMSFLITDYGSILEIFFLGLAVGGFIKLSKSNKMKKLADYLIILLGIFFSLLPEILLPNMTSYDNLIIIIIGGILSSLAFIMPGISGSLILLSLGIYSIIIESLSSILKIFINRPDSFLIIVCITFLVSFVIGAVLFSKIIKKVLLKYERLFLNFCLGLLLGSICIIFLNVMKFEYNFFIKFILCILGIIVVKKL